MSTELLVPTTVPSLFTRWCSDALSHTAGPECCIIFGPPNIFYPEHGSIQLFVCQTVTTYTANEALTCWLHAIIAVAYNTVLQ
jgi:hypothetical protein